MNVDAVVRNWQTIDSSTHHKVNKFKNYEISARSSKISFKVSKFFFPLRVVDVVGVR